MREKLYQLIETRQPEFIQEAIDLNAALETPVFSDIELVSMLQTEDFRDDIHLNFFLLAQFKGIGFERCIELDLSRTSMDTLPSSIGYLRNLRRLNLSHSQIGSLPSEIAALKQLEVLNLSHTELSVLSSAVYGLARLRELDLSYTRINKLPKSLGYLQKLERLQLAHTRIASFPIVLQQLRGIRELDLSHTRVSSVPSWLEDLDELSVLNLRFSRVTSVPREIENMPNLRELIYGDIELYSGSFHRDEQLPERLWEILMAPMVIFCTIAILPFLFLWDSGGEVRQILKDKRQSLHSML